MIDGKISETFFLLNIGLMAKKHGSSEIEYLRGLIRNLKSENKSLKKQLGRSQKKERLYDAFIPDDTISDSNSVDVWTEETIEFRCQKCKSTYSPKDLGTRILHICNDCGYTKSTKKV